ncbi:MAG: DUF167 domain-containing protein [Chloroflexi bacterium]|nr:DUF167 domain-containing protein [Chloroflexota bacterium]
MAKPEGGSHIEVWLQPRASKTRIVGRRENGLKVAVCAPPVEGKANEELIKLMSDFLDLPKSKISIKAGSKSRNKLVYVEGMTPEEVQERITKAISSP